MEDDERFKHLATDPRFKRLRKKQRKVEIDERFQHMFTDERFTLKYSKDKRGQAQKKTTGDDLKKYYFLKEDSPVQEEHEEKPEDDGSGEQHATKKQQQQEVGEDEADQESDVTNATTVIDEEQSSDNESETNESELSSSSDEASSDEEELEGVDDIDRIKYDWQPLDHDADVAESTTKRLAIQNLDWDRIDSKDLYTLVNSIRPPVKLTIYVSEFGKERLKRERLEGPQEIVEMPKEDAEEEEYNMLKSKMEDLKNPKPKALRVNEYEDADEELDPKNEEIRERVRRYQLSRLKYYYAVVEFDSVESAELVYKELDGMEFEGSSLELDLRFIPDDVSFDEEDVKEECNKLPDLTTYKVPQFISSALQQTTVKFTWDETDIKRQEKLHKAYTKEELEKDDLDAYLASESDSDELDEDSEGGQNFEDSVSVVTANSEARLNKYKLLLKSLEEEEARKKKASIDVEWDNVDESGSEGSANEEDGEESDEAESGAGSDSEALSESYANDQESEFEDKSPEPVNEKRTLSRRKDKRKEKEEMKKNKKKKGNRAKKVPEEGNEELDLLVMDAEGEKRDEFKFNPEDKRFNAVYESALYNIDPSHPNFKRTPAFDLMAEKKREKRQKTRG